MEALGINLAYLLLQILVFFAVVAVVLGVIRFIFRR